MYLAYGKKRQRSVQLGTVVNFTSFTVLIKVAGVKISMLKVSMDGV